MRRARLHSSRIVDYDLTLKRRCRKPTALEILLASLIFSKPTALSQLTPDQPPVPVEIPVQNESAQPENGLLETPLSCGPNQFPSAFSDVYPTDWAYQAVNRLSSRAVECFDYPSERSPVR